MTKRAFIFLAFSFQLLYAQYDHIVLVTATGNSISQEQATAQSALMKRFFTEGLGYDDRNIQALNGEDATKENIITAIQRIKQSNVDDRVVIYMLGESYTYDTESGNARGFFIPSGVNLNQILEDTRMYKGKLAADAIAYLELRELIAPILSKNIMLILDSNAAGLGESYALDAPQTEVKRIGHGVLFLNTPRHKTITFENGTTLFSQHLIHAFQNCTTLTTPNAIAQGISGYAPAQVRVYSFQDFEEIQYPCAKQKILQNTPTASPAITETAQFKISNMLENAQVWSDGTQLPPSDNGVFTIPAKEQVLFVTKQGYETNRFFFHPSPNYLLERGLNVQNVSASLFISPSVPSNFKLYLNNIQLNRANNSYFPVIKGENYLKAEGEGQQFSEGFNVAPNQNYSVSIVRNAFSSARLTKNLILPFMTQIQGKRFLMGGLMALTSVTGGLIWSSSHQTFKTQNTEYQQAIQAYRSATTEATATTTYAAVVEKHNALRSTLSKQRIGQALVGTGILTHILDGLLHAKIPLKIKISKI